jgi:hypothetical protein
VYHYVCLLAVWLVWVGKGDGAEGSLRIELDRLRSPYDLSNKAELLVSAELEYRRHWLATVDW